MIHKDDKLRVDWSKKENDLMFHWPIGHGTVSDGHYLNNNVFTEDFIHEMKKRGYDLTTIKFQIDPLVSLRPDKFKTLSEKYPPK